MKFDSVPLPLLPGSAPNEVQVRLIVPAEVTPAPVQLDVITAAFRVMPSAMTVVVRISLFKLYLQIDVVV